MIDFFRHLDIGPIAAWITSASIICFLIYRVTRSISRGIRNITKLYTESRQVFSTWQKISYELQPNGGYSLVDKIDRIDKSVVVLSGQQRVMFEWYNDGIWQSDLSGECIYANRSLSEMMGLSIDDLKGRGWVNAIHPEDRDKVYTEWFLCVKESRAFVMTYRFLNQETNEVTPISAHAYILKSENGTSVGYIGYVKALPSTE